MFLPYHRASLAKAGMPKQNGETHAAAGDIRSQEASFVLKTNDPAGFTIVDVRVAPGLAALGAGLQEGCAPPCKSGEARGRGKRLLRRRFLPPLANRAPTASLGCR